MNEVTLSTLKTFFAPAKGTSAIVGRMPIAVFNELEPEIRKVMKANKLRAWYRGPRKSNAANIINPTTTRRIDATHVMLYRK